MVRLTMKPHFNSSSLFIKLQLTGSHTTFEFVNFYREKFIIPFYFLPYTTHLCQPLDEHLQKSVQRHIQRSIDANTLLYQEVELLKASLKKAQSYKSTTYTPKNGKSLLRTKGNVLSPICANRMMVKRQDANARKLKRLQAKHAKELEAQQRAQEARDLLETKHKASMAARDSNGGN
ncbi:hypothetical protein N7537_000336, partial [Penicillium hordei]